MITIAASENIRCFAKPYYESGFKDTTSKVLIYFSETIDNNSLLSGFTKYLSPEEISRAEKFRSDSDRNTYISCHALLRLILAKNLNTNPLNISFLTGINGKPYLYNNPVYFNIAHTKGAFAIAIATGIYVGIDLEKINREIDFFSITERYFSNKERDFIFNTEKCKEERFFLLWTRKEALLKALGTGIIDDLLSVEVSDCENSISTNLLRIAGFDNSFNDLFLYSEKSLNNYMSIAVPQKSSIDIFCFDKVNILPYLF